MVDKAEARATAEAYCAWLNEGNRLRHWFLENGYTPPFTIENMWRVPATQGPCVTPKEDDRG